MSIPAVKRIRAAFPGSFIALHTRKWAQGVFGDMDLFDEIITFEHLGSKIRTVIEQSRMLRGYSFDMAVLLPNSFESALTVALAGIPRRLGYRTDGRRVLLTDSLPVPEWKSERHESEFYLNLTNFVVQSMGGVAGDLNDSPLLTASSERKRAGLDLLCSIGIDFEHPIVAIGPGSTNSMAKRWPTEYFAQLCDAFANSFEVQVVLLGSASETDVGEVLTDLSNNKIYDLTGKTDLQTATAILKISDLFVSNDMGLAHIAAGLGTPTLTLFGPTNEIATAPLGPKARFVREVVECSPCMLRECPIDHRCMRRLLPERVFEIAAEMLRDNIQSHERTK